MRILGSGFLPQISGDGDGTFSPLDITGLKLWLDSADGSSLWQDTAATIPSSIGDPVAKWQDKSENANHATPLNGEPSREAGGVSFNNSPLLLTSDVLLSELTIYIVAKSGSYAGDYKSMFLGGETNTAGRKSYLWWRSSVNRLVWSNTSELYVLDNGVSGYSVADRHVVELRIITAQSSMNIETSQIGVSSVTSVQSLVKMIGGAYASNFYLQGEISEIIIYDSALNTGDRTAILDYLIGKWI